MSSTSQSCILIATQNPGKIREFKRMLQSLDANLLGLDDFEPVAAPIENGETFRENAIIKAQYYSQHFGKIAIADDSGLEVDALNGAPGVHSARYGGEGLSDAQRTDLLLENLRQVPTTKRTARFKCVVVVCGPNMPEQDLIAEGVVEGHITFAPRGNNGFGYDPVFVPIGDKRSTAEMNAAEKDALSHRGRAITAIMPSLAFTARR